MASEVFILPSKNIPAVYWKGSNDINLLKKPLSAKGLWIRYEKRLR
jgi:hypothetical protein